MTAKERERDQLRSACAWDREAYAAKASAAVMENDWQFLIQLGRALKPRAKPKNKEKFPLHARINSAFEDLFNETGGDRVTMLMIKQRLDPEKKIPHPRWRVAFRRAKLRLPRGKSPGRPKAKN